MTSASFRDISRLLLLILCVIGLAAVALTGTGAAQATGTLEGTVENEIGEPIEGATISINGTPIAETSDDGSFRNSSVIVGVENVSVNHPDYEIQYREPVTITTDETTTEDFVLERTTETIGGIVRTGPVFDLEPVSGVTVEVEHATEQDLIEGSDNLQTKTTTDESGEYRIEVPSGDVSVVVRQDGFSNERRSKTVPNGGLNLDITLDNTVGTINGTVSVANEDNPPIDGANISVDVDPDNWTGIDEDDITDQTGPDGQYSIVVPSGTRTITVDAETFQRQERLVSVRADQTINEPFRLTHNQLRIDNVIPQTAQSGDTVTLEYTYAGDFQTFDFTVGEQGQIVPTETVDITDAAGELTFEIPDRGEIEDGTYTITLETPRRTATETITVSNPVDPDSVGVGVLGEESYRAPAGGFVDITTGGEYMLIGGDRTTDSNDRITQYLDVLYVEDGSTTINTRLIGTDVSSERAYGDGVKSYAHSIGANSEPSGDFADVSFEGASTLAEFRRNVGIDGRSAPLQTGRYRLLAGENGRITIDSGIPRFRKPVGRSNLVLTQPQLEAVNTYVLPPDSANAENVAGPSEDATESSTIAEGERLLIEIQATGMYGATVEDPTIESIPPKDIANLLEAHEGVNMNLATWYHTGSGNTEADLRFANTSSSDVYIIPDDTTDQWEDESVIGEDASIGGLYIVVDTRSEAFSAPSYGDIMKFRTAYESPAGGRYVYQSVGQGEQPPPFDPAVSADNGIEHFPYFGDGDTTVAVNSTIRYMEPSIQYGRTTIDDELIVPNESDGQILGSTTMAPGTEATIQFIDQSRSDPELVTIEEVTIGEDRRFTASADFSALESGDQVTVEFYTAGRLPGNRVIDRRGVRVVEDIDNTASFQISNLTSQIEVQQRASLEQVEATIDNTGELTGQQIINFSIDGEPIREETLRLSGGGSETLDLSEQFVTLPIGNYTYTVRTDDDEATGQLTVTPPDSGTTITSADNTTATSSSPLGDDEMPGEGGDGEGGLFGLLGLRSRDVVVATAVTGAVHVLGYWA